MISPTSKMLFIITNLHEIEIGNLTVCVTCVWAGVDSVWEQEKLEARKCLKMPQNPTRQVHALLAGVFAIKSLWITPESFSSSQAALLKPLHFAVIFLFQI